MRKTILTSILVITLVSCGNKVTHEATPIDTTNLPVDTIKVDTYSQEQDNSWLMGEWEFHSAIDNLSFTILDSQNAIVDGRQVQYYIDGNNLCYNNDPKIVFGIINFNNKAICADEQGNMVFQKIKEIDKMGQSEFENSNSQNNSWLIGTWEVQTDVGLMNLTIIDSQNATFLDESGTYAIESGVLRWRDRRGIVSPFTINYSNHTLNVDGSNYILKKTSSSNNDSQSSSSSIQSNKTYKRSYRDNFSSRSAVFEFLSTHTFRGSDGTRITYDMSTLKITFSNGKSALFTNIELLGYNQNIAKIRAICTNVAGYSTTLTLDSSDGTITDSDGTTYTSIN